MKPTSYQNGPRPALPDGLLLECVVTTLNSNGAVHVAPMGPIVNRDMTRALLRPYQPSQTLDNLTRSPIGVLHVTDDVLLIAAAATGTLESPPATFPTRDQRGAILADACRWHEFEAISIDDSAQRAEVDCRVVGSAPATDCSSADQPTSKRSSSPGSFWRKARVVRRSAVNGPRMCILCSA